MMNQGQVSRDWENSAEKVMYSGRIIHQAASDFCRLHSVILSLKVVINKKSSFLHLVGWNFMQLEVSQHENWGSLC